MTSGDIAANSSTEVLMRLLSCLFLLFLASARAGAQWHIAALAGNAASHGDARNDIDPAHPEFHADRPITAAVALGRDLGAWRVSVELRRSSADLSEVGNSSVVVSTRGAFDAWGAGVEFGHRIAGRLPGPTLHAIAGAGADRWRLELSPARWRPSVRGAVEADLPIGKQWFGVVRGEATAGPSVFTAEELPEGFAQRRMWRTGVALGVARTW
jgi:hypothetical protein